MTPKIHSTGSDSQRLLSHSMLASKNSVCFEYCDIQLDVSAAVWGNKEEQIITKNQGVHTLSLYLEGGENAYRLDKKHLHGGPGKVCYMPAGHESEWLVDDPLRLLHLYFTQEHIDYLAVTAFDIDPRVIDLQDLTYCQDDLLAKGLHGLLMNIHKPGASEKVMLQEKQQMLILYLLQSYSKRKLEQVRSGLSPYVKRQVLDYIEESVHQDLSLQDMANVACLSSYHFARMFKKSIGMSPYQFLLKTRMQKAMVQLKQGINIMVVANDCGYDNHSHFARAFRKMFGMTPSAFQGLCK